MSSDYMISLLLGGLGALCLIGALLLRARQPRPEEEKDETIPVLDDAPDPEDEALTARLVSTRAPRTAPTPAAARSTAAPTAAPARREEPQPETWQDRDSYRPSPKDLELYLESLRMRDLLPQKPGQVVILTRKPAFDALRTHLKSDTTVELGGLLLGPAYYDEKRDAYLLQIEAAIPAEDGLKSATSFAYTPQSWRSLTPHLQQMPADWTLLGSYHSHPGMGVFLSETDRETQQDIFSQDWQTALIYDPVSEALGFFVGRSGEPCLTWRLLPPAEAARMPEHLNT
jgi:proteasome lid subunit RPN8/RPN11